MAIPWLTLIKVVPWTDVIANAPRVVDGAKKLWGSVNKSSTSEKPLAGPAPGTARDDGGEVVGLLRARVGRLEAGVDELHAQMRASSDLIRTLADQNAELIRHLETVQVRVRWLSRALVALGLVSAGLLAAALA